MWLEWMAVLSVRTVFYLRVHKRPDGCERVSERLDWIQVLLWKVLNEIVFIRRPSHHVSAAKQRAADVSTQEPLKNHTFLIQSTRSPTAVCFAVATDLHNKVYPPTSAQLPKWNVHGTGKQVQEKLRQELKIKDHNIEHGFARRINKWSCIVFGVICLLFLAFRPQWKTDNNLV